jgi:hypothetical protein
MTRSISLACGVFLRGLVGFDVPERDALAAAVSGLPENRGRVLVHCDGILKPRHDLYSPPRSAVPEPGNQPASRAAWAAWTASTVRA